MSEETVNTETTETAINQPQEVGTLTEEEMGLISQLRQNANQLLNQLGQLELRKTRIAFQIERNEAQAQEVVASARERLGIPEDAPWQIQENGTVVAILPPSDEEATTEG
jgi:chaperonin cofactor prefoldin